MPSSTPDVVLIGSGIMSANLGVLLKQLDPNLSIHVYEVADQLSPESSHGWNNAGTGHAGICELSYTPHREPDGTVNVAKAIGIFEEFEQSLQFWAHAVDTGVIDDPRSFINPVDHISFVRTQEQVDYLRARHAGLAAHHFFAPMEFTTDKAQIATWSPLLTEGRIDEPIAATRMVGGSDVNFGVIATKLLNWLGQQEGCAVMPGHRVTDLTRHPGGGWQVEARELATGATKTSSAKFVFVGAGGGSILLLQKAGLPEARGLGGFPIGGQWLVCDDPAIVERHDAKVYGQALGAAPTMAVPHLDTRILDGKKSLLFGPFASWTTKFLHQHGKWTDLPRSIKPHNLATLLKIGWNNLDLVRYLMQQGTQSMADRMKVLHEFYPDAKETDWKLIDAGIRVQAIKKTDGEAGIVHYGTEVLTSADRSMSALLGASPGASTSVHIITKVVEKSFPHLLAGADGLARIQKLIPSYGIDLQAPAAAARYAEIARPARTTLGLKFDA
ncbi:malate dehydrogenase (quinone) [Synoicihabitans lomoniglobus]|uniref:Probable malate:quinone oxidoreductase n=1 Tax=Synoicihabitans lomoniglobus TaxID=2909285 RepID=A0AAE9ZY41_9BACT|nr:malate dehydrogenase (quinone) [Opitutaceae bacterium LMO-M01]WED65726.1 malate dehydrogenase (quinone) [Opitutaceae bacterium LMO-M01]